MILIYELKSHDNISIEFYYMSTYVWSECSRLCHWSGRLFVKMLELKDEGWRMIFIWNHLLVHCAPAILLDLMLYRFLTIRGGATIWRYYSNSSNWKILYTIFRKPICAGNGFLPLTAPPKHEATRWIPLLFAIEYTSSWPQNAPSVQSMKLIW